MGKGHTSLVGTRIDHGIKLIVDYDRSLKGALCLGCAHPRATRNEEHGRAERQALVPRTGDGLVTCTVSKDAFCAQIAVGR